MMTPGQSKAWAERLVQEDQLDLNSRRNLSRVHDPNAFRDVPVTQPLGGGPEHVQTIGTIRTFDRSQSLQPSESQSLLRTTNPRQSSTYHRYRTYRMLHPSNLCMADAPISTCPPTAEVFQSTPYRSKCRSVRSWQDYQNRCGRWRTWFR